LRFQNHSLDGVSRHSPDACQKFPLIRIWSELCINKNTVIVCAWKLFARLDVATPSSQAARNSSYIEPISDE
jgi:hypothetical protein